MKKILKWVLILFIGFLTFLTGQTAAEHLKIRKEIKNFTSVAIYQEEMSTDEIKYYKVSRETYYPDELYREAFYNGRFDQPGAPGDILLTQSAPYPSLAGLYEVVTFYFGGHAAYMGEDNLIYDIAGYPTVNETFLEVFFKGGDATIVSSGYNYWLDKNYNNPSEANYRYFGSYYRKEFLGLRIKGVTAEDIEQTNDYMLHLEEIKAQYNFQYIIRRQNRYYCTDMMSRAYGSITISDGNKKYNLNQDGVAVTVNDLILSKDTYISFYVKTDSQDVKHIYFIG